MPRINELSKENNKKEHPKNEALFFVTLDHKNARTGRGLQFIRQQRMN